MSHDALNAYEYRDVANNIPALCWLADETGFIYWYNTRWFDYTGTDTKGMEGWGWQSVHHPKTLPMVLERWKASLATNQPFDMVFPLRSASGEYRPFLTKARPIINEARVKNWFGLNVELDDSFGEPFQQEWTALQLVMSA